MGIVFNEIYTRAIGLFDDPKITMAYQTNKIQFYKLMYTYLQTAISQFSAPSNLAYRLSNYVEPNGILQKIEADGINNTFQLDTDFIILNNSEYVFIEGDLLASGVIDIENRMVSFPDVLPIGQEYAVEQYYIGEFLDNFSGIIIEKGGDEFVKQTVINILARLLVASWAENQRNFLLDIKNTMTDTDFKLTSNAAILKSKIAWVKELQEEIGRYRQSLDWKITADKMINNVYGGN